MLTTPVFPQGGGDAVLYIYAQKERAVELGTGFFVDGAGRFLTAYHVVVGASTIEAYDRQNRKQGQIRVLGVDPLNDVALLLAPTTSPTPFLRISTQSLKAGTSLTTLGHPQGFKFQLHQVRTTQDGVANSTALMTGQGRGVFSKSFPVIPLDLTIYGGMSGAPVLGADGAAVAMLSGSYNTGGSIAWGIPGSTLLALRDSSNGSGVDVSKFPWRPLEGITPEFRSFAVARELNVAETIEWLNDEWKQKGVRSFVSSGFDVSVDQLTISFDSSKGDLTVHSQFSSTGDTHRLIYRISLRDASRATFNERNKVPGGGYFVVLECPTDRTCVSVRRDRLTQTGWKTAEELKPRRIPLNAWYMEDIGSADRLAMAISHLIQLHGGPVPLAGPFGK